MPTEIVCFSGLLDVPPYLLDSHESAHLILIDKKALLRERQRAWLFTKCFCYAGEVVESFESVTVNIVANLCDTCLNVD